jgi:hypothetical protein
MFGLFKRTKVEKWEIDLLKSSIGKMSSEYSHLLNQINDGLLKGVLLDVSDIKGYVAFTYNNNVLKKYENENEKDYKLTNIKIYDKNSSKFYIYDIYVSGRTISGYSLNEQLRNFVLGKIDLSEMKKVIIGESDFNKIAHLFNNSERELLNPALIYSIWLENKEFFHLFELEDGDFIGITLENKVYEITHDPYKIQLIDRSKLISLLKKN